MASGAAKVYHGSYIGTGAAKTIDSVPFPPKSVEFVNITDGTTTAFKWAGMDGSTFVKVVADAGPVAATTQGVTLTDDGFDLGTDAAVNESGKTFLFRASE